MLENIDNKLMKGVNIGVNSILDNIDNKLLLTERTRVLERDRQLFLSNEKSGVKYNVFCLISHIFVM
jgi:hypothetical protein